MDRLERLRYQTADRRKALLDEMINVELLAREAERRGLDQRPETVELIRQLQRDEVLRELRASLPAAADLPAADVSRYYQEHREEFHEPERRRAAQLVLGDEALARRVLAEAKAGDADRWRELVAKHGDASAGDGADPTTPRPPLDVPGDLGMFTLAAGDAAKGEVPEAIRRAAFEIPRAGEVHPEPVLHAGRFHIVRLVSKVDARQRSLEEVDAAIRARLLQGELAKARAELVARLRKNIAVSIDDDALERVAPPTPAAGAKAP
jgi:hypothetical protein